MAKLIECPACKNKVSIDAESCPKCGQPLSNEIKNEALEKQKNDKKNTKMGCIIFIIACILIGYFFGNDKKADNVKNNINSHVETKKYDENLMCPGIDGLYLGMPKDVAINILKEIANKFNLNMIVDNFKDSTEIRLNLKKDGDLRHKYVLMATIKNDEFSHNHDKVIHLSFSQKLLDRMGYPYNKMFDNFISQCTSGENITKYISPGGIHTEELNNHVWGTVSEDVSFYYLK